MQHSLIYEYLVFMKPLNASPNLLKSNERRWCLVQSLCDRVNKTKLLIQFKPLDASWSENLGPYHRHLSITPELNVCLLSLQSV